MSTPTSPAQAELDKMRVKYRARFTEYHEMRRRAEAAEAERDALRAAIQDMRDDFATNGIDSHGPGLFDARQIIEMLDMALAAAGVDREDTEQTPWPRAQCKNCGEQIENTGDDMWQHVVGWNACPLPGNNRAPYIIAEPVGDTGQADEPQR